MGFFDDPSFQNSFSKSYQSSFDSAEKDRRDQELLKAKIKAESEVEQAKANQSAVALQDAFKDDPQVGPVFQKLFSKGADKNTLDIAKTIISGANTIKAQEEKIRLQSEQTRKLNEENRSQFEQFRSGGIQSTGQQIKEFASPEETQMTNEVMQKTSPTSTQAPSDVEATFKTFASGKTGIDYKMVPPDVQQKRALEVERLKKQNDPEYAAKAAAKKSFAQSMSTYEVEQIKKADEAMGGMRQTALRLQSMAKAFPPSDVPWEQRIKAVIQDKLSDAGIATNKEAFAIKKNLAQAILALKDSAGMAGVMTEADRSMLELFAKDLNQGTGAERYSAVRHSFVNTLAKMTPRQIEHLKTSPETLKVLSIFDVDPDNIDYGAETPKDAQVKIDTNSWLSKWASKAKVKK